MEATEAVNSIGTTSQHRGAKGAKGSNGAKEHGRLVHHIESVAKARENLDKAKKGHDQFVGELYKKHGGHMMDMPRTY